MSLISSQPVAANPSLTQSRRAVVAASFGNVLEWFDFTIYGLLASILAVHIFQSDQTASAGALPVLLTFATFGVGFLARPLGGYILGRFSDKRGRRPALIFTIVLMGISTGVMGLLPDYSTIGVIAPILLVLARLAQGFAAGGEWGGAASFLVEWAPKNRRGLLGSIHPATIFIGLLLGSAVIALLNATLGADVMAEWGWRLPFLFGGLICLIALPFRLKVEETPIFVAEAKTEATERLSRGKLARMLVLAFALVAMQSAAVYTFATYFPSFIQANVVIDGKPIAPGEALWSNTIASFVVIVVVLLTGALSDRIGRKPGMLVSCIAVLVLTYPLILLVLNAQSFASVVLIQAILAASVAVFLGSMPAALVELFPARIRVTGLSTSYNVASAIFGGFAPFIATALIQATGMPIAASYWVIFAAMLSTVAVLVIKESRGADLR